MNNQNCARGWEALKTAYKNEEHSPLASTGFEALKNYYEWVKKEDNMKKCRVLKDHTIISDDNKFELYLIKSYKYNYEYIEKYELYEVKLGILNLTLDISEFNNLFEIIDI